jgi:ribonuclease HII
MPQKFDRSLLPDAPDLSFEIVLWNSGLQFVAGVDEAGRGALAGPVAAAAVIFPCEATIAHSLVGVRDSKEMSPAERELWAGRLHHLSLAWGVGFASHQEIDAEGILPATRLAMMRALEQLSPSPQHLLADYLELPECSLPQSALVKGDARSLSIAAASILAKTARDEWMRQQDVLFPGYGFAAHKGYGTTAHRNAIARLGLCPIHRRSFKVSI